MRVSKLFSRVHTALTRIEIVVSVVFLVLIVVMVLMQVSTRVLAARPWMWTEELARYSLVWLTFIGSAAAAASNRHIAVEFIESLLSKRAYLVVRVVGLLICVATAVFLLEASQTYLERVSAQRSAAAGLPMNYVYGGMVLGFALMALHWLVQAAQVGTGRRVGDEVGQVATSEDAGD